MKFVPIASSSAGCAYLVTGEGGPSLLIDCGVHMDEIQKATGYRASGLAGCLISHSHGDHCKSAQSLALRTVELFGSKETIDALFKNGTMSHRATVLQPQVAERVGPWTVMGFPVVHDCPGTMGFLVAGCGGKLLYLTDTAYSPYRFEGVTVMAVEANFAPEVMRSNSRDGTIGSDRFKRTTRNHMSLPRLIDMLKANDLTTVEEIWLLHLSDANSDEREFKEAVQKATGKPVYVAQKNLRGGQENSRSESTGESGENLAPAQAKETKQ